MIIMATKSFFDSFSNALEVKTHLKSTQYRSSDSAVVSTRIETQLFPLTRLFAPDTCSLELLVVNYFAARPQKSCKGTTIVYPQHRTSQWLSAVLNHHQSMRPSCFYSVFLVRELADLLNFFRVRSSEVFVQSARFPLLIVCGNVIASWLNAKQTSRFIHDNWEHIFGTTSIAHPAQLESARQLMDYLLPWLITQVRTEVPADMDLRDQCSRIDFPRLFERANRPLLDDNNINYFLDWPHMHILLILFTYNMHDLVIGQEFLFEVLRASQMGEIGSQHLLPADELVLDWSRFDPDFLQPEYLRANIPTQKIVTLNQTCLPFDVVVYSPAQPQITFYSNGVPPPPIRAHTKLSATLVLPLFSGRKSLVHQERLRDRRTMCSWRTYLANEASKFDHVKTFAEFYKQQEQKNYDACCVCLEPFTNTQPDDFRVLLDCPCQVVIHRSCLIQCEKHSDQPSKCPVCRGSLLPALEYNPFSISNQIDRFNAFGKMPCLVITTQPRVCARLADSSALLGVRVLVAGTLNTNMWIERDRYRKFMEHGDSNSMVFMTLDFFMSNIEAHAFKTIIVAATKDEPMSLVYKELASNFVRYNCCPNQLPHIVAMELLIAEPSPNRPSKPGRKKRTAVAKITGAGKRTRNN